MISFQSKTGCRPGPTIAAVFVGQQDLEFVFSADAGRSQPGAEPDPVAVGVGGEIIDAVQDFLAHAQIE